MFVNKMPRYEILSPDAMEVLDRGWRKIVSEIGVEFILPEAVEIFRAAGCKTEGANVWLDPEFVLEQVAKVPREFELQARNPEKSVTIGGDNMVFSAVYGPPFARRGRRAPRGHDGGLPQLRAAVAELPELDTPGGTICEPNDAPLDSRHLDMVYALMTLSDKPHMGSVTSGPNAADTIAMSEILFGSREAILEKPASLSLINVNSPLRFDDRMLSAMLTYNRSNQAVIITPFLLMGAMSPVTIPSTLVQQIAEALAGITLDAARESGLPGGVRLVSLEHRPAVGLAELRHAGVGHRPALHRPDRAPLRAAVALGRWAHVEPDAGRPGGLRGAQYDAADVPRRRELRRCTRPAGSSRASCRATRSSSSTSRCCGC